MLRALLLTVWLAAAPVLAQQPPVNAETFAQEPALPDEYRALTYAQRLDWLRGQLETAQRPALRYKLLFTRAEEHFINNFYDEVLEACRTLPPPGFHLEYRFFCLAANEADPAPTIPGLMDLHVEALAAGEVDLAAQALSVAAWRQSATGDIRGAFDTYAQAMAIADDASPDVFDDVSVNTATLYVMHGDPEYVQKGIELHKAAIERFKKRPGNQPDDILRVNFGIALSQFNTGVAYTLHLHDYEQALHWLGQVDPGNREFRGSVLVFSALAAAELGRRDQARAWLAQSLGTPVATGSETGYLACYQELVRLKTGDEAKLAPCRDLHEQTSLEVSLDLYKRMSALSQPEWRRVGLEGLHRLFIGTLEPQLKQSSARAASRTELNRLALESRLKDELLGKEQALKRAQQEKLVNQRMLGVTGGATLLLVIALILLRLRSNRKLARQFLAMSVHDGLTGLHNRRYFEHNIEREISQARRAQQEGSNRGLAMCLLDIDHFKRVNDTWGHEAGDAVLVEFARRVKMTTRESDMLVRWGGEEFLLLAWLSEPSEIHVLAERVRTAVAGQPFSVRAGLSLDVTCTIGAAVYPRIQGDVAEVDWQWLLQLADAALYMGKHSHRNCWVSVDNVADPAAIDGVTEQSLAQLARDGRVTLTRGMGDRAPG